MQKNIATIILTFAITMACFAQQATFDRIRTSVFQTQCNNSGCHTSASAAGGLSLEGTTSEVRAALYNVQSTNAVSQSAGNKRVFPGHPYRSKMFLLINNGLALNETLLPDEDPGNVHANLNISNLDKELIRQWIFFDSPTSGQVVSHTMLEDFYGGNGIWATDPANPPAKPDPSEGFQIHLGPLFLPPWDGAIQPDEEYHYKYATLLPNNIEINRLDGNIGSSHHMILFRYNNTSSANSMPYGLQQNNMGGGRSMVAAFGQSSSIELPQGTAFKWYTDSFLDINTHVVNYSPVAVMATDVYINVYTQPFGTAAQEMKTTLLINPALFIPYNSGVETFTADITNVNGLPSTYYIWKMSSHTHRHGLSFNVWHRNSNGTKGEHIYDANKYNGVPECEEIGYDYQHPPTRVFGNYLPIVNSVGLIQEATYSNNDVTPFITWGNTVNDEMMITGIFYLDNITGIEMPEPSVCFADEINVGIDSPSQNGTVEHLKLTAYPNPTDGDMQLTIISPQSTVATLSVLNLLGKEVWRTAPIDLVANSPQTHRLDLSNLAKGLYLYQLTDDLGNRLTGRLAVR
ncbi:MAG: T9SS type A sorting domain-containing protein [Sphingobacteriales bacterium]|nr:MAG: T9SS type A sorting domain-containing protein [Sphingobacteriales bacterium]